MLEELLFIDHYHFEIFFYSIRIAERKGNKKDRWGIIPKKKRIDGVSYKKKKDRWGYSDTLTRTQTQEERERVKWCTDKRC